MNIHEFQAKALLADFGVAVPRGGVAFSADEARQVAADLGGPIWVVKSQIHAGGRGAGRFKGGDPDHGGVRLAKSVDEVVAHTDAMLGNVLVTKQTGPDGKEVGRVYVEEGCDIARELYLSLLVDRATSRVTVMASTEGGMEIEEVAEATPEKIITLAIDPVTGLQGHHARRRLRPRPRRQTGRRRREIPDGDVQSLHRARHGDVGNQPAGGHRRRRRHRPRR